MDTQAQKAAAACTRAARWPVNNPKLATPKPADMPEPSDSEQESLAATQHSQILCIDSDSDDDCGYTGGVNVCLDSELEEDSDGSDEKSWLHMKKSEAKKNCQLGYNGLSRCTKQQYDKKVQDRAATHEWSWNLWVWIGEYCTKTTLINQNSNDLQVLMVHTMFMHPKPSTTASTTSFTSSMGTMIMEDFADLVNYPSNLSNDSDNESSDKSSVTDEKIHSNQLPAIPKLKRQKLDIPYHKQGSYEVRGDRINSRKCIPISKS
jgi:hypothetical protein